jgi:UDP-N-acetylglucosamine/UDP-N-acetylgalactosamine 4-epimerase
VIDYNSKTWLVTGAAGFIGSHLCEALLKLKQNVIGLDNFSTGNQSNLDDIKCKVGDKNWSKFKFIKGDIVDFDTCVNVCEGVDIILHQAALGSVPRSIENPIQTNQTNISGTLNIFFAGYKANVSRIVYASSSSVYGDSPDLPKRENNIGSPLSPYAISKRVNELYAEVFNKLYGLEIIGLRYFNVFGPRQNPEGPYAAVIPKWLRALKNGIQCEIYGDGETSRDFCYIANVVHANLIAATINNNEALGKVFNIALGQKLSLNELYKILSTNISRILGSKSVLEPKYSSQRPGDVRHSLADIDSAKRLLGYSPTHDVYQGLSETIEKYLSSL